MNLDDALMAHRIALREGGLPGVRDIGLIESAIARPYHGYYRTLAQKAAALLEAVAQNHAFHDGNKRTALILTLLLIDRSGYELEHADEDPNDAVETLVLSVVEKTIDFADVVTWFKARLRKATRAS